MSPLLTILAFAATAPAAPEPRGCDIPIPAPGLYACTEEGDLCLMHKQTFSRDQRLFELAADALERQRERIAELEADLKRERASKTKRCATVTPDETCKRS